MSKELVALFYCSLYFSLILSLTTYTATIGDTELLLDLKIETVIDLRNLDEIVKSGENRKMDGAQKFYNLFSVAPKASYPRNLIPNRNVLYEIPLLDNLESFWEAVAKRTMNTVRKRPEPHPNPHPRPNPHPNFRPTKSSLAEFCGRLGESIT